MIPFPSTARDERGLALYQVGWHMEAEGGNTEMGGNTEVGGGTVEGGDTSDGGDKREELQRREET